MTFSRSSYEKTMLNLNYGFWHECSFRYYYKFKGTSEDGYLWDGAMQTEEYEHWVQQTCTANFQVSMRSTSGTASLPLPDIAVLGKDLTLAGVSVRAKVSVQVTLGLSASLTYGGADVVYAGGRVQQSVKIGCRDECRPFTSDIIFERDFEALNYDNFNAVDNLRGTINPSVSLTVTAGIMGNFGSIFGDWGFMFRGGVKLSLPAEITETPKF